MKRCTRGHGGGDGRLDTEIRRAVTELVELAPLPPTLEAMGEPQAHRRGRTVAAAVCALIAVAIFAAALTVRDSARTAGPLATSSTVPPTQAPLGVVPPPQPVPQELADPSDVPNGFPLDREVSDEAAFPGNIRHRSGGPYLSEVQVRERVRDLAHCAPEPSPETGRCDGMVVRYFDSYEQAFKAYGPPFWSYYDGTIAHDREVYLATVYGALPYCNRALGRTSSCPIYRDHRNIVIDATTGQTPIG